MNYPFCGPETLSIICFYIPGESLELLHITDRDKFFTFGLYLPLLHLLALDSVMNLLYQNRSYLPEPLLFSDQYCI